MIGQYLSNTNKSATVSILQNFLELNKAKDSRQVKNSSDAAEDHRPPVP